MRLACSVVKQGLDRLAPSFGPVASRLTIVTADALLAAVLTIRQLARIGGIGKSKSDLPGGNLVPMNVAVILLGSD
jgi:hypothetical protein